MEDASARWNVRRRARAIDLTPARRSVMGIVLTLVLAAVVAFAAVATVRTVSCARLNRAFRVDAPSSEAVDCVIASLRYRRGSHVSRLVPSRRAVPERSPRAD